MRRPTWYCNAIVARKDRRGMRGTIPDFASLHAGYISFPRSNRHIAGHPSGSCPPRQALEHRVLHAAEMPHADRVVEHPLTRLPPLRLAVQQGVVEGVGKAIAAAHAGEIFVEPHGPMQVR